MNTIQKILFLFFLCGNLLFAGEIPVKKQERLNIPQLQEFLQIKEILQEIQSTVFTETSIPTDITIADKLFSLKSLEPSSALADFLVQKRKIESEGCNTGLKFTAMYRQNQEMDFVDDDTIPYKWRGYLGFEWDLLENGLFEHKKRKEFLEANLQVEQKLLQLKIKDEKYPFLKTAVIYLFNQAKKENLKKQINFLSKYLDIVKTLYFSHRMSLEDVQKVQKSLWRVQNIYEGYLTYEASIPEKLKNCLINYDANLFPVVEPDIQKIQDVIRNPLLRQEVLTYRKSALSYKYDSLRDVELAPFLRYYIGDEKKGTRDYLAFGFSVEVPIPFHPGRRQNTKVQEEQLLEADYDKKATDSLHDMLDAYSDYKYKLDDSTVQ